MGLFFIELEIIFTYFDGEYRFRPLLGLFFIECGLKAFKEGFTFKVSVPYWGFFLLNYDVSSIGYMSYSSFRPLLGLFFIECYKRRIITWNLSGFPSPIGAFFYWITTKYRIEEVIIVSVPYWGFFLLNQSAYNLLAPVSMSFRPLLGLFFIECCTGLYLSRKQRSFRPLLGLFFIESVPVEQSTPTI